MNNSSVKSASKLDKNMSKSSLQQRSGLIRENSSHVAAQVLRERQQSSSSNRGRASSAAFMPQASSASVFYEQIA